MGAVAANGPQVMAAEVEPVRGQDLVGPPLVDQIPLELEEQQLGLDRRALLLGALHECSALGVPGVEREVEHGVGARSAHEVVDRGQLAHGVGHPLGAQLGHLATVLGGEGLGPLVGLSEQVVDALGAVAAHERLKVPGYGFQCGFHAR